jgi:hypothetical protein
VPARSSTTSTSRRSRRTWRKRYRPEAPGSWLCSRSVGLSDVEKALAKADKVKKHEIDSESADQVKTAAGGD